ncbi:MAG: hypothetical protein HY815_06845 [Candidatus Riflebacteria bacterium]|nr:hypothetical protein [Candidatus Riflebacteria bacterium]
MGTFRARRIGIDTIHGEGGVGGKADGLLALAAMEIGPPLAPLRNEILSYEVHERYRACGAFDEETASLVEGLAMAFDCPIAVRPSQPSEDDPERPTSGGSVSYMLPNNHPDPRCRVRQLRRALKHIYECSATGFCRDPRAPTAVIVSPIHGILSRSNVGTLHYPLSSGVADSICTHPISGVEATVGFGFDQGFARVAFGHGYSTVRMDFDVVPVLGILGHPRPAPPPVQQRYLYALNLERNAELAGQEMETMCGPLSLQHADPVALGHFGSARSVDFKTLVEEDRFGYASGLRTIMEKIASHARAPFQIEFTFNVIGGEGVFHVVQYKTLRNLRSERVEIPEDGRRALLDTNRVQGHGVIQAVSWAVVINPFTFEEARRGDIRSALCDLNQRLKADGERYVLICPGKVGTTDPRLGFHLAFDDLDGAALIVEYGYDVHGAPTVEISRDELTGGTFGSHFLYQILGGAEADRRIRQWKALGSQGTHFLTNLIANRTIFAHVDPTTNLLDGWFFIPPDGHETSPIYAKRFEEPVTIYADIFARRCQVK